MRVCFLVNDLHLSGGIGTVVRHASLLRRLHDIDAELVLARDDAPMWDHDDLEHIPVLSIREAHGVRYDVAVATWWQTADRLADLEARRRAFFVQSLEDRFYEPRRLEFAFAARQTLDLPVSFITEARWIHETIRQIRPDAPCYYVRNGVAKDVFVADAQVQPRTEGPLRILIEGRADVWFKGVPEAVEAATAMQEPRHVTLLSPSGTAVDVDRILGPVSQRELAALYRQSDVLLKLSRIEGMYGPPLEAFHLGATCVTTPVTGHDEYICHGWNALVVDWDDPCGTGRMLDLLARDRRLLHFLRTNALATARAWPGWEQASQFMALTLRKIARDAPMESSATNAAARAVRLAVVQSLASELGVPPPGTRRARILARLWSTPGGARALHLYGRLPGRRVASRVLRRVLG